MEPKQQLQAIVDYILAQSIDNIMLALQQVNDPRYKELLDVKRRFDEEARNNQPHSPAPGQNIPDFYQRSIDVARSEATKNFLDYIHSSHQGLMLLANVNNPNFYHRA